MKKLLRYLLNAILALILVLPAVIFFTVMVFAAPRDLYWVGGTDTWNATAGAKWSLASGGAGGEAIPDSDDNVFFDGGSGVVSVTISTATCANLDCAGGTGTFAGSWVSYPTVNVWGSLTLTAGMTITNWVTPDFKATSGSYTVTSAGKPLNPTFSGNGGTWALADNLSVAAGGTLTLTGGTFNTANRAISGSFLSSGAVTRTLNAGSTVWTVGTSMQITGSGMTFNCGTSSLVFPAGIGASDYLLVGGGTTFYDVSFLEIPGPVASCISGANTFHDLTIVGKNATTDVFNFKADQVITGTLTMTGYNASDKRMLVCSDIFGTYRQLTAANFSITNCNLRDISAGNPYWDISAGKNSDYGGCYGIYFTVPQNNYWVGNSGSTSQVNHWALTTGGAGGTGRVPLVQDTAIFDANSFVNPAATVTVDCDMGNVNASTVTNTPTFSGTTVNVVGSSFNLGTVTWSVTTTVFQSPYTQTIISNSNLGAVTINAHVTAGLVKLMSNITCTGAVTLTSGSFDLNGYSLTATIFASTGTLARILSMGEGTFTLNGTGAVTKWGVSGSNYVQFCETSTIVLTDSASAQTQTFTPGTAQTFRNVTISGAGDYTLTISAAATFYNLTIDRSQAAKTVRFPTSATTTITGDFLIPSSAFVATMYGTTTPPTANVWTINKTSGGAVVTSNVSIEDSTATPALTFYAGVAPPSVDVGHNTGWIFTAATVPAVTTSAATGVSSLVATLNGNVTSLGAYSPVYAYFEYGPTASYGLTTTEIITTATGIYNQSINMAGLTHYHFRATVRYTTTDKAYGGDLGLTYVVGGGGSVFTPIPAIPSKPQSAFVPVGGTGGSLLPSDAAMKGTGIAGYSFIHLIAQYAFNSSGMPGSAGFDDALTNDAIAWALIVVLLFSILGIIAGIYTRSATIVALCCSSVITIYTAMNVVPLGFAIVAWIITIEIAVLEPRR